MKRRADVLELAVLGILADAPTHGYELRKRLNAMLGSWRALSYGTLYPALRVLRERGWISEGDGPAAGGRGRIVYQLTPDGKEHLQALLGDAGPAAWEDERFAVHVALFGRTREDVRLRILEGRRSRLEERREGVRAALARTSERLDRYTLALQEHGLESVDREVRWLSELIETERGQDRPTGAAGRERHTENGPARAARPANSGTSPRAPRPGTAER